MESISTPLVTKHGKFQLHLFSLIPEEAPIIVLVKGDLEGKFGVLTRIQSECLTGHLFQSLSCDCNEQLQKSLYLISKEDEGIVIYLRQEGRGIGLTEKVKSYILQKQGFDTVEANLELGFKEDERQYDFAALILKYLKVGSIRLLTNNPKKVKGLESHGIEVQKVIEILPVFRKENEFYLRTKVEKMGHTFKLE